MAWVLRKAADVFECAQSTIADRSVWEPLDDIPMSMGVGLGVEIGVVCEFNMTDSQAHVALVAQPWTVRPLAALCLFAWCRC